MNMSIAISKLIYNSLQDRNEFTSGSSLNLEKKS